MEAVGFSVIKNLQEALQAISVAGGYHYDVEAVAVKLDPNQDVEALIGDDAKRPFLVIEVHPSVFTYQAARRVSVETPVTIHAVHDSEATDDDSWLQTFMRLCADVEKAIAIDIRRGGLATIHVVEGCEFQTFGGSQVWAMVKTRIRLERVYGTPSV